MMAVESLDPEIIEDEGVVLRERTWLRYRQERERDRGWLDDGQVGEVEHLYASVHLENEHGEWMTIDSLPCCL
jgi:hypothetical protein